MNIKKEDLEHALSCKGSKMKLDFKNSPNTPIFSQDGSFERYERKGLFITVLCNTCYDIKKKYKIK